MKQEINVAATFLASLLSRNSLQDHQESLECQSLQQAFSAALQRALYAKLLDHWHPSIPEQGQAYRAICINHKPDYLLEQVAQSTGISLDPLPAELILWIDPMCVSYKLFDGPVVVLMDHYSSYHMQSPTLSPIFHNQVPSSSSSSSIPTYSPNMQQQQMSPPSTFVSFGVPGPSPALSQNYPHASFPNTEFRTATASPISIKRPDGSSSSVKSLSPPRTQASLVMREQVSVA